MGWYSYITWGIHGLDTSSYDNADAMVEKYKKLYDAVQKKINDYGKNQELAEASFDEAKGKMDCYDEGTTGHWVAFYSQKVAQWKENQNAFYTKIDAEYQLAKERQKSVADLIETWEKRRSDAAASLNNALEEMKEDD